MRLTKYVVPAIVVCLVVGPLAFGQAPAAKAPAKKAAAKKAEVVKPTDADRERVRTEIKRLKDALATLPNKNHHPDVIADAEIYLKAAEFMDRFDEYSGKNDVATLVDQIETGISRVDSLKAGQSPWAKISGSVVRGYRSDVDRSVQPYVVEIPAKLDLTKPSRLDVVLHGRNAGLNESRFIKMHEGKKVPDDRPGITLHMMGRTNNAYRWAGETDVFESIKAVKRNYLIDEDRIVLRGFSMGGAGAWHLGLHYPSLWVSVEAGAGFTDTWKYTNADPAKAPEYRVKAARLYDAVDYALNAFDVPMIGYGGENDTQLKASTNIVEALEKLGVTMKVDGLITKAEGLDFTRVVGKGMGHQIDPASQKILNSFHDDHAKPGLNRTPKRIRFVTYTLAYNTAAWISVERMIAGYEKTTVEAELRGEIATITTKNVNVLAVDRQVAESVNLDGQLLPLRLAAKGLLPKVYYQKTPEGWVALEHDPSFMMLESGDGFKSPATHGPIDDAFRGPFLLVLPSAEPWNPTVAKWADERAKKFQADFARWMRGDVPVKRDVDVTPDDIESKHLILMGDPGSNKMLARVIKDLPITWTKEKFTLGETHAFGEFAPVLIAPNPLNRKRYVVVNSGHTLEESDFIGTNALLYPRIGDWGVFRLPKSDQKQELVKSGYFNQRWRMAEANQPR